MESRVICINTIFKNPFIESRVICVIQNPIYRKTKAPYTHQKKKKKIHIYVTISTLTPKNIKAFQILCMRNAQITTSALQVHNTKAHWGGAHTLQCMYHLPLCIYIYIYISYIIHDENQHASLMDSLHVPIWPIWLQES